MALRDLREFVKALESRNWLKRVKAEVSSELEISEVYDRVVKKSGPALLFENVKGYQFPVLVNAFGSMERMALALNAENISQVSRRFEEVANMQAPESLIDKAKLLPKLFEFAKIPPKLVSKGACQEVVISEPDLSILPALKCWPGDGGKYLTLPVVITKSPKTGIRNLGMYRMQIFDKNTTGMHWHWHKGGAQHYREAEELGRRLEVAVALGGSPAVTYASTAPVPEGVDEYLFAGFLNSEPVETVRAKTVDLEVPADAEFILEGYVEPKERRLEGPFGDHTGFYSLPDQYPVFHLTCITHRKDAIFPATVVGRPPMEDCFMAKATERIFLVLLKKIFPEIVDLALPIEGIFHNYAFLSIDKRYPGHAFRMMYSLWGLGQMMFTKWIVVFDKEVNVQDTSEVLWRMGNNIDPGRDIIFVKGPADVLDHAAPLTGLGTKIGVDATRKWKEEGFERDWPDEIKMSDEVKALVSRRWKDYGID
jgi:4-hydroxy-3-polyprenylbenzoate decarboxylase